MSNKLSKRTGFTIIELMIATAIFSAVLLVFLAVFIQISRLFYKGVNMAATQEAARTILSNVSDDIRFSSGNPSQVFTSASNSGIRYYCLGQHRYRFMLGNQIGYTNPNAYDLNTNFGTVREDISGGCPDPGNNAAGGSAPEEMLDNGMQLNSLVITCAASTVINERCHIIIHVVFYADRSMLASAGNPSYSSNQWQAPDAACTGAASGSQFCATASYNSTVLK